MAKFATGKVKKLFVQTDFVVIILDIPEAQQPLSKEFRLEPGRTNYNSMYSLLLAATVNKLDITIRAQGEISKDRVAMVDHVVYG